MMAKTTEERRANTDKVFDMENKEEQARQAKKDRLRQAREKAELDRRS